MSGVMNLMQNNYFGYVYGESIDEIINECNLAKNLEIIKEAVQHRKRYCETMDYDKCPIYKRKVEVKE